MSSMKSDYSRCVGDLADAKVIDHPTHNETMLPAQAPVKDHLTPEERDKVLMDAHTPTEEKHE